MKQCSSCQQQKPITEFYSDKSKSDGVRSNCKDCHNNTVKIRNSRSDVAKNNLLYRSAWEVANQDQRKEYKKTWYKNDKSLNPKKYSIKYKKYFINNKGKITAKTRKRELEKMRRTPMWLNAVENAEIETAYLWSSALRKVGVNSHVDHILPLQGKSVSGLHVPSNLQVVHASYNLSKGNEIDNLPPVATLAAQCAETTLTLYTLQNWVQNAQNNAE